MCPIRRLTKDILAVGLALSLSSCACAPDSKDVPFDVKNNKLELCLKRDKNGAFEADSVTHPIYCFPGDLSQSSDRKPPVLLLHELPGLSGKTLHYAEELSRDFTVYVPLLFGELNMHSVSWGLTAFWLNGEWRGLESGDSKIVPWLRAVVAEIERVHPQ